MSTILADSGSVEPKMASYRPCKLEKWPRGVGAWPWGAPEAGGHSKTPRDVVTPVARATQRVSPGTFGACPRPHTSKGSGLTPGLAPFSRDAVPRRYTPWYAKGVSEALSPGRAALREIQIVCGTRGEWGGKPRMKPLAASRAQGGGTKNCGDSAP